jgi:hypothetical protein
MEGAERERFKVSSSSAFAKATADKTFKVEEAEMLGPSGRATLASLRSKVFWDCFWGR